ncbi:MAG: hypothetical protein ACKO6B_05735, partial [Planctomycetia bacterium]
MNVFDSLFPRRTARSQNRQATRPTDSRHRLRRLAMTEQLERRSLMAIDSFTKTMPNEFFIDFDQGPLVNSQYASYKIENGLGVDYSDVWIQLTSYTGGAIAPAQFEDGLYQIGPMPQNTTALAYLYFSATGTTNTPQSHTLQLFNGNPLDPAASATPIFPAQTFTYTNVEDVLSTNDSKIDTITVSPAPPTIAALGSTITMIVTGQLGQADNVLFTPACRADWKPDDYVLESTKFTIDGIPQTADQIFFSGLPGGNSQQQFTAEYTFRVADITGPTITAPTQFTQKGGSKYKNDETQASIEFPGTYNPVSVEKLADGELRPQSDPLVVADTGEFVTFTLRFTNTSSQPVVLNSITDILPAGMNYTANFTGAATYTYYPTGSTVGSSTTLLAPVVTGSGSTLFWPSPLISPTGQDLLFRIAATSYADLTFQVKMPKVVGDYENSSIGKIGKVVIDTTPNTTTDIVPATAWVATR